MTYLAETISQQVAGENQVEQLVLLKLIERHLAEITDLELKEEDEDDSD